MKYEIQLQSKPEGSVEEKHQALLAGLQSLDEPWSLARHNVATPDFGNHFYATVSFNKYLPRYIKASVHYRYRNMLEDTSLHDDFVNIEFNTKKIDLKYMINEVFPALIKSFNAYCGCVANEEILLTYFKKSANKNLRKQLVGFYPVHYLSGLLCTKALGLSCLTIRERLENTPVQTQSINGGILLISSYTALDIEESVTVNNYLQSLLNAS